MNLHGPASELPLPDHWQALWPRSPNVDDQCGAHGPHGRYSGLGGGHSPISIAFYSNGISICSPKLYRSANGPLAPGRRVDPAQLQLTN